MRKRRGGLGTTYEDLKLIFAIVGSNYKVGILIFA